MQANLEFSGKTVLVTGGSTGIGAEAAVQFAQRGAFLLLHYAHDRESADQTLQRIRAAGADGLLLQADLSTRPGIDELIARLDRPIHVLVNNAGSLIRRTPVLDFTPELWDQVITLNLTSAFFVAQAVLRGMKERRSGSIVNVSSVAARNGGGIGALAYASAKGALSTMTKGLAKEFAPHGIRINAVSPGTIDTNYHRKFSTPQVLDSVAAATPMGRLGTSGEVADAILFLCSEAARFIQGQVIEVNGGFLMV